MLAQPNALRKVFSLEPQCRSSPMNLENPTSRRERLRGRRRFPQNRLTKGKSETFGQRFRRGQRPAPNGFRAGLLGLQLEVDRAASIRNRLLQFGLHLSLGLVLVEMGDLGDAENHLAEALRLEPDDPFANYYYGYVLHRQGKLEEAAGRYSRALDKDPKSVPALLALAVMRMKPELPLWHDPQKAVSLAETACELTGRRSPDPLKILAAAYAAGGRNRDALDTANEALRLARTAGDQELAGRIERDRETHERAVAQGKADRP